MSTVSLPDVPFTSVRRSVVYLAALVLIISGLSVQAQTRTFLSPGVKFGYQWGAGMFAGLEISYTVMPSSPAFTYGATFNIDLLRSGGYKAHVGLQCSNVIGASIGPNYAKELTSPGEWGYSGSVFTLVGLMPFYTFTGFLAGRSRRRGC